MKLRIACALSLLVILAAGCGGGSRDSDRAVPQDPSHNPDGDPTTGTLTARFDPSAGAVPFPSNLLFSGTTDLTLNIPVADPNDFGDPQVALNALDGFSTVAPWSTAFSAAIAPASIIPGSNVRVFEVTTENIVAVTGVVRELVPGEEFFATAAATDPQGQTLAIVPLAPLKESTTYLAVLTDTITDAEGNPVSPDQPYFLAKRTSPLVDGAGRSTDPLLPDDTAQALEPLRQIINTQEAAAAAAGIERDRIVLSWAVTTQSVSPVLKAVRSMAQPTSIQVAPTGLTTADVLPPGASPGIADVYLGVLELPYYLEAPSADNPAAPLSTFWRAAPCGEVPQCAGLGLDPTSTHLTFVNPLPVERGRQTVPVLMSVPNAASGQATPAAGWPVAIFQHGITRNRSDMLALADTMASVGFAVIAIDQPLHGITDVESPLYVSNTPFAPVADERTFDLDLVDNDTGAPGPDGLIDGSGAHFINLASLLTSRDNLRQAQADLSVLALNLPDVDLSGDGIGDIDGSRISFIGQSLGAIVGTPFLAVEPTVNNGVLSAPGGGIAGLLHGSQNLGPVIRAGLEGAGVAPFSPDYFQFLGAAQTVVDAADPINWGAEAAQTSSVLVHQVAGDAVIPNAVDGFPLSGTEPLIRVMGLEPITGTTQDPMGIRGAARFIQGVHGSLLSPEVPAVTAEMQGQAASMLASGGTTVVVDNPSVIQTD